MLLSPSLSSFLAITKPYCKWISLFDRRLTGAGVGVDRWGPAIGYMERKKGRGGLVTAGVREERAFEWDIIQIQCAAEAEVIGAVPYVT